MTNGLKVLTSHIVIKTIKGALFCLRFECKGGAFAGANTELVNLISINTAHQLREHDNKEAMWVMALRLGWYVHIGKMMPCEPP